MKNQSDSNLPFDTTPSLGSTYGLDGFEDAAYNEGVEGQVTLSQYGEFPAFPTGLSKGGSSGMMDLSEMIAETSVLSNLSWLEDAFQDIERLPKNPVDRGIPELVEAWGANRPTNGVLVHARDLEHARYADQVSAGKKARDPRMIRDIVTAAMRKSAAGQPLDSILRDAYLPLGDDGHLIKAAMDVLRDEHGLAGNVFIRASAYPSYEQGKWTAHLRKVAQGATYLIVDPSVIKSASWIINGRCTMTSKKVVTSVPWGEAYAYYAPRLQVSGYKIASEGSKKSILRQAFLAGPSYTPSPTALPTHTTPSERITAEAAKAAAANHRVERRVLAPTENAGTRLRKHVMGRLASLHRSNVIPTSLYNRLVSSDKDPKEIMAEVVRSVRASKSRYNGSVQGENIVLHTPTEQVDLNPVAQQRELQAGERRRRVILAKLDHLLKNRIIGASDHKRLASLRLPEREWVAEISKVVNTVEKKSYQGQVIEQHIALRTARKAADLTLLKFGSAVRWVRQAMSEGFAGRDLNSLVDRRFSDEVLSEARPVLDQARKTHEGASGFIYVDAAAYASEHGVKGCEQGAAKHRTNTIRTVLAMDRCSSCSHARSLEDGTVKCGIYGKVIMSADDFGADLDRIKTANIRTANSSDAEVTASMFASKFDPTEFSLHNSTMSGFDFAPLPDHGKMADVVMGGMILDPD